MELCNNIKFLAPLRLVLLGIDIIKIVVPIILVVICMITLFKSIFNEEKELNEAFKKVSGKLILAVSVYLVPTIITLLLSVIGDTTGRGNCIKNAKEEGIQSLAIENINKILEDTTNVQNLFELETLLNYIYDDTIKVKFENKIEDYKKLIIAGGDNNKDDDGGSNNKDGDGENNNKDDDGGNSYVSGNIPQAEKVIYKWYDFTSFDSSSDLYKLLDKKNKPKYNCAKVAAKALAGTITIDEGKTLVNCQNQYGKTKEQISEFGFYVITNGTTYMYYNYDLYGCKVVSGNNELRKGSSVNNAIIGQMNAIFTNICKYANSSPYLEDGYISTAGISNANSDYYYPHRIALGIDLFVTYEYNYNGKIYKPNSGYGSSGWNNYKKFVCEVCNGNEACPQNVNYHIYNNIFKNAGWCWGGNWSKGSFDPMHFELKKPWINKCEVSNKNFNC